MTNSELQRFRTILTASVAELEEFTRHREALLDADRERSSDYLGALSTFVTELKSLQTEP